MHDTFMHSLFILGEHERERWRTAQNETRFYLCFLSFPDRLRERVHIYLCFLPTVD